MFIEECDLSGLKQITEKAFPIFYEVLTTKFKVNEFKKDFPIKNVEDIKNQKYFSEPIITYEIPQY